MQVYWADRPENRKPEVKIKWLFTPSQQVCCGKWRFLQLFQFKPPRQGSNPLLLWLQTHINRCEVTQKQGFLVQWYTATYRGAWGAHMVPSDSQQILVWTHFSDLTSCFTACWHTFWDEWNVIIVSSNPETVHQGDALRGQQHGWLLLSVWHMSRQTCIPVKSCLHFCTRLLTAINPRAHEITRSFCSVMFVCFTFLPDKVK